MDMLPINSIVRCLPRRLIISICLGLFTLNSLAEERALGGDFTLTSHLNKPYSSIASRGKIIVLFFGFTHCPDVCPNTLSTVQTALNQMGDQAIQVQPLFISVDPKRDTPEVLKKYMEYFGNNFIGLTGKIEEIDKVVKQFHGFYSYEGNTSAGAYTVDHTSNLYVINQQGTVTNIIPYGLPPQAITAAVKKLLPDLPR